MLESYKAHIKYALKINKNKNFAKKANNRELESIYDQLLFANEAKKYASYITSQTVINNPNIENYEIENLNPSFPKTEDGNLDDDDDVDSFPNRISPDVFPNIKDKDITDTSKELENELKSSVRVDNNKIEILDSSKVQKIFAILFLKYGEELARVAVAHFMGLPSSIRNWAISPIVPSSLIQRYNNKLMQETTIQNIVRLRGKLGFDPKIIEGPGRFAPSEVEESTIGQEIIDRTMEVLLNKNGIYLGNIEQLVGYIVSGEHQKEIYQKKQDRLPKDAIENLKELDIQVDPNSFDGRFLQGLGKLVFTVVAQQFLERWGAVKYDHDTGVLQYRHLNKELYHPSGQVSFDDPGFGNPALRNVYQFVPIQGKRHDINLQDEQEFILRRIFDINESGQQAFNELYDLRVNKSDQQYLGQHLAVDAKMLAQKIVANIENLFGRYDEEGTEILKPSNTAFKSLFALYMQIMSWLKDGRGGFQSSKSNVVKVPPQMLDYLGVSYNKDKIDSSEEVRTDNNEIAYKNDFIPISPFGMSPSAAKVVWETNMNRILGAPIGGGMIERAETPREIYREIFVQINNIGNKEQLDAMNRILANELHKGVERVFSKKLGELVTLRKKALEKNQEYEDPSWNKHHKSTPKDQHMWAEYAAVLYALINNIEIITEVAPVEIISKLTQTTQEMVDRQ